MVVLTCPAAAMGASYAFASTVSANLRQKNDSWNQAIGGLVGGSMIGLTRMAHAVADMAVLVLTFSRKDYASSAWLWQWTRNHRLRIRLYPYIAFRPEKRPNR